ncbi:conserved unknown protein [Ectocarpus siliculosus]|uniref:Uncharacterized protein n=1 Tax=Ectocarpus siliculosus TaxID=2880 RepID=D8LB21_ECTSI|nr:conserved unknown protein [Ectocarpus siliculosus]|eukprot:CBN76530.1 conserved unknown protein [Ectocarpus siliculosus]
MCTVHLLLTSTKGCESTSMVRAAELVQFLHLQRVELGQESSNTMPAELVWAVVLFGLYILWKSTYGGRNPQVHALTLMNERRFKSSTLDTLVLGLAKQLATKARSPHVRQLSEGMVMVVERLVSRQAIIEEEHPSTTRRCQTIFWMLEQVDHVMRAEGDALHPAHRKAMKGVIDNMNDDIRDTMKELEEFRSMDRFKQFLRAPGFEQRMKKSEEVIKRAEDNLYTLSVLWHARTCSRIAGSLEDSQGARAGGRARSVAEARPGTALVETARAKNDAEVIKAYQLTGVPRTAKLCGVVARRGQLGVLQWLRETGCPWNEGTCCMAAEGGHLDVLKWARENGCPWDEWTCAQAAAGGHLDVLKWARKNGCPWDDDTCFAAKCEGHLDVLKWAEENGCPEDIWGRFHYRSPYRSESGYC